MKAFCLSAYAVCGIMVAVAACQAPASAAQIRFHLEAEVPVKCNAQMIPVSKNTNEKQINIVRSCNIDHKVEIFYGGQNGKEITFVYANKEYKIKSGHSVLLTSGPVYDKIDAFRILDNASSSLQFQISAL